MITTKGVLRKIEKGLQHDKQANYNLLLTFMLKHNGAQKAMMTRKIQLAPSNGIFIT